MIREVAVAGASDEEERERESQAEVFLQTRTVGLDEVQRELGEWREAMTAECHTLKQSLEAVKPITESQLSELVGKGLIKTVLPGKAVFTRKAGQGARKCRVVVCGNYQEPTTSQDLYASGTESVTIRSALAQAAKRRWRVISGDVKSAFLQAPLTQEGGEIIAMRPPSVLVRAGVVERGRYGFSLRRCMVCVPLQGCGRSIGTRHWQPWKSKTARVNGSTWSRRYRTQICGSCDVGPSLRVKEIRSPQGVAGLTRVPLLGCCLCTLMTC